MQRDVYFLCIVALCLFPISLLSFVVVVLDRFFVIWETNKVVAGHFRQVVVLYSNNYMEICLGGLSIGCLRGVVVL